jgi:hypothetical protein
MRLELLDIRKQPVQDFLWTYIEPTDFRHDYTRLDAIKEVERQVYDRTCQLWGDLDANFVFRCVVRNPKVIEPHIMGDGRVIRTAFSEGLPKVWSMGFEKVVIWTHLGSIARIMERFGFRCDQLPRMHMGPSGELLDQYVLTMERQDAL